VPVVAPALRPVATALARRVARCAGAVERVLMAHREAVLRRQLILERIAWAAISLVTAACTLSRLDAQLAAKADGPSDREAALLYLRMAFRRCDESLRALRYNDDPSTLAAADAALRRFS
jgi:acyl-CoA dehydrogenase family protein 9